MPMTLSHSQAHEMPWLRIRARFPDGSIHQTTVSSTYRPCPDESRTESYRQQISKACDDFYGDLGATVLEVVHLNTASVEVGHE